MLQCFVSVILRIEVFFLGLNFRVHLTTTMEGMKTKTKKFKLKHPKRKLFRSNDPLLSVFMWGVNHCVKELQHVSVPVMLMPDDFRSYSKVKIDNQSFNKENLPSHFKVKEYCPIVFRNLRERFGIDDMDFVNSLTKSPKPMENPGKSGAKLYISYDKLYVLKTLTSEEVIGMKIYLAFLRRDDQKMCFRWKRCTTS